jgi:hypothetical protein
LGGGALAVGASSASGQWTATILQDPVGFSSAVQAVYGGRQAGWMDQAVPGIWSGSAATWQSLSAGRYGQVYAMYGDLQGGTYQPPGGGIWASLWRGTPESQTFLNPDGYFTSQVRGMWGNEQVGTAGRMTPNGPAGGACLWHGTAASFVLLHPAGAFSSQAVGTDGAHEYGTVQFGNHIEAVMWSGTPESVVSLDPSLAGIASSHINAAGPGRQAGFVVTLGSREHAAMWSGSAQSFVDLNPNPTLQTDATGVCSTAVVGTFTSTGPQWQPAIWAAPDFAFQPLPIPLGFTSAFATCVEFYNGRYYVGGYALSGLGGYETAVLWTNVPSPSVTSTAVLLCGLLAGRRRRGGG